MDEETEKPGINIRQGPIAEIQAVNAGSNSISSFSVHSGGLVLADTAAGAAQVAFSPNQETLVVSEKNTMVLDTCNVLDQGLAAGPITHPSNGMVPYGFTFTGRDELLVTEAGSNAVSSYDLDGNNLATVSASLPSQGAAPCWITATPDGGYAYATNAHIGTIAGFKVGREGPLTFLGLTPTASIPVLDIASAGHYVYALAAGMNQVLAYRVLGDGSLDAVPGASGLPATAVGLAAR